MKRKFSMLLLLTMLLPLTSCNSLEGKEIVAGEFPKGGKEVSYQDVKNAIDSDKEEVGEVVLPNAMRVSLSSDTIKLENTTTILGDYVDGSFEQVENKASVQVNNLRSSFEIDGLTQAKGINELTAKASLGADLKVNFESNYDDEYTQLINKLNDKSINLNGYLSHSNFYLDMDDNTNQLIEEIAFGNMYDLPNKVYLDAALLLTEDMFPLLSLENIESIEQVPVFPNVSIDVPDLSDELQNQFLAILCDEFVDIRQYKDEFLAVINLSGEQLITGMEKVMTKLYEEGILDDIEESDKELTQEEFNQELAEMKEDLAYLKDELKSFKLTYRFNTDSISEIAFDFLYNKTSDSTETFLYDIDFKVAVEYFEKLEIEFPEFDSSYKSLLASLA